MKKRFFCNFLLFILFYPFSITIGDDNDACFSCHNDKTFSIPLESGEELSLFVDSKIFLNSVHGDKITCIDCHNISLDNHPTGEIRFKNRREYSLTMYEACKKCHFSNYTKLLESVHYYLLSRGNFKAPVCVDCHGYHSVDSPYKPRYSISRRCAKCHQGIYNTYALSVHGRALIEENNQDVPVCTDCHKSHNIEDPRTAKFLIHTPDLCGNCHANEKLMKKYGISTNVLTTYLNDFHGISISSYKREGEKNISSIKAVCVDCHGVHNITKTDIPKSSIMRSNLVNKCRKCHINASENFPDTWISHYEPTLSRFPIVYFVKLFYKIFIPFIIGGLILHILLHIWRIAVNR